MASVCPLCFITKMEIQTIWHPSLTKMEMQTNGVRHSLCLITKMEIHYGVRLSVMFDHKDGNSKVWHPLLFSNFTKIEM
jgi:hypothetical protein